MVNKLDDEIIIGEIEPENVLATTAEPQYNEHLHMDQN